MTETVAAAQSVETVVIDVRGNEIQHRSAAVLASLASFAMYFSPLPTHGSATTVALQLWQQRAQPFELDGWMLSMFATVLLFQALLGGLVYRTLRHPNRSRLVAAFVSLPVIAVLFVVVLYTVGSTLAGYS